MSDFEEWYSIHFNGIGNSKVFAEKVWEASKKSILDRVPSLDEIDSKSFEKWSLSVEQRPFQDGARWLLSKLKGE